MMEKYFKAKVCLFLFTLLSVTNVFPKSSINTFKAVVLATAPPTVVSPIYFCQNSVAAPLTATPSGGGTLNWYTSLTGGVGTPVAPTPSTATVGSITYYVTQTIGTVESSPRTPIVVNVVADNGSKILLLRCDPTQILAADRYSSVYFDWTNTPSLPNQYTYSYTVDGGPAVKGTTSPSNLQVFGLSPGQSVTLTVFHTSYPCDSSVQTCTVPCITTTTPTFAAIPPSCLNAVAPILPLTSINGITGTWNPSTVDTSTMGTTIHTFTPDPMLFPCATKALLPLSVEPIEPDFDDMTICSGDTAPILNNVSPNGITGTWNPTVIDNMNSGAYVFTPDTGQLCTPTNKTINVTINPSNTISSISWTVTEAFSKNQIVTVTDPIGGNYLYQMDSGVFQASTVFENVAAGTHTITVKNVDGCSVFTDYNVLVIGYPKYFTPNGDNYNDVWNIPTLNNQQNARIYIFDRYGKLLKDISPLGAGWDGTYIGRPMPADDYWFTVEYVEENIVKKYKSHFSLKR